MVIILSNRSVLSNLIILNFPSVLNSYSILLPSVSDRWFNLHSSIAKRCALRALSMRVQ